MNSIIKMRAVLRSAAKSYGKWLTPLLDTVCIASILAAAPNVLQKRN